MFRGRPENLTTREDQARSGLGPFRARGSGGVCAAQNPRRTLTTLAGALAGLGVEKHHVGGVERSLLLDDSTTLTGEKIVTLEEMFSHPKCSKHCLMKSGFYEIVKSMWSSLTF